jgi:glycogen phosphorylase
VWLNNPIAPLEASGTSGIKAAINGRLNLSVLDGWWAEGWAYDNGWGIPPVSVRDPERRDALEAQLILEALEEEVVPLYYERNGDGYSTEWVRRSKRAMMTIIPQFSTQRMLQDYLGGLYQPAARQYQQLAGQDFAEARTLAEWKQRVRQLWPKVDLRPLSDIPSELPQRERLQLRVAASLAGISPGDVRVEFVARRRLPAAHVEPPELSSYRPWQREDLWTSTLASTGEHLPDGADVFALDAQPLGCGQFATEIRIYPFHELLSHPFELGLMKWL